MKRVKKGCSGYIRYEKVKRALITLIMFAIPIIVYFTALKVTGTNRNIMTIVAVLGMIPAAKFAVSWIMILLAKNGSEEAVKITEEYAKDIPHAYELIVTAYEGRMPLDAVTICGNEIVCVSTEGESAKFAFMEKHITKIMNSNQYFNTNVKIFGDLDHYRDRIRRIAASPEQYRAGIAFKPDDRYPQLSREEILLHLIMAISI